MLTYLNIKNIVLIKSLSLSMGNGLTALTGETGAGKSILLDSLGLTLGYRSESGLIRKGSNQGSVTASFDLPSSHRVFSYLKDKDLEIDGEIILRRTITSDGRSKAFINDLPVSVSLLKEVGEMLVDIHGQFETHGLLDSKNHGDLLDGFAKLGNDVSKTCKSFKEWRSSKKSLKDHQNKLLKAKEDEEYLISCVSELEKIDVSKGEEDILLEKRQKLLHFEAIIFGLNESFQLLDGNKGGNDAIYRAVRSLEKIADKAAAKIDPLIEKLDQNLSSLRDIAANIEMMAHDWGDDENIEYVDDRIHELRAAARKHNVLCDDLPDLLNDMKSKLDTINSDDKEMSVLEEKLKQAEIYYYELANNLSIKRKKSASKMSNFVCHELPDLKLNNAVFRVSIDEVKTPTENGIDAIEFLISTNSGSPEGALGKIASGGELSRIMLAIKVVLSKTSPVPVMVFDEVDSGMGGSTADAIGNRLSKMANDCQILVVTHSPQVAAKANHHWIISKADDADGITETMVKIIGDEKPKIEEIARMLSGASLTSEARAAAKVLRDAA